MSVTALRPILRVLPGGCTGPVLLAEPAEETRERPSAESFARALLRQGLVEPDEMIAGRKCIKSCRDYSSG